MSINILAPFTLPLKTIQRELEKEESIRYGLEFANRLFAK